MKEEQDHWPLSYYASKEYRDEQRRINQVFERLLEQIRLFRSRSDE